MLSSHLEIAQLTEDYNIQEGYIVGLLDMSEVSRRGIGVNEGVVECGLLMVTVQRAMGATLEKEVGGGEEA